MYAEQVHEQLQDMREFLEYREHRITQQMVVLKWVMVRLCSSLCVLVKNLHLSYNHYTVGVFRQKTDLIGFNFQKHILHSFLYSYLKHLPIELLKVHRCTLIYKWRHKQIFFFTSWFQNLFLQLFFSVDYNSMIMRPRSWFKSWVSQRVQQPQLTGNLCQLSNDNKYYFLTRN